MIEVLQSATIDGGVHLVQTISPASESRAATLSLEELREPLPRMEVTVERGERGARRRSWRGRAPRSRARSAYLSDTACRF